MSSDWIELKILNEDKIYPATVRVYSIESVSKTSDGACKVYMDSEHHYFYSVGEPYEEVMAKIAEAEGPVDLSNCVVEHFTYDEYASLRAMVRDAITDCEKKKHPHGVLDNMLKKLNEILEES